MSQQRYRRRNINPMRHRIQINPNRSILLEDFRENRYGNFQLGDIVSHVVEFASDAEGSKFIQIKLDEATDNRKEMVFREMRQHLRHLMIHRFGNFVVQKFFDVGTMQQQFEIIVEIRDQFLLLSLHKYGCRIVQKAIQSSTIQYQNYLMQAINQEAALRMAVDANGNHVIQKIFRVASLNIQVRYFGDSSNPISFSWFVSFNLRKWFSDFSLATSRICAKTCMAAVWFNAFWKLEQHNNATTFSKQSM